ncbi:unnamed protein product [Gongylonema pulchrum]|uniref:Autophagy-related protein n=1 Tax=Gongylonema pulchrum TaxID=637853 RepID=A0A183DIW1_9BILA|nr:unnamed protein product [Gongylonema pulchrum]
MGTLGFFNFDEICLVQDFDQEAADVSPSILYATINEGVKFKDHDTESARMPSPLSSGSEPKKKSSGEDDFELQAKKSLSLRNRKLSFAGLSSRVCFLFRIFLRSFNSVTAYSVI